MADWRSNPTRSLCALAAYTLLIRAKNCLRFFLDPGRTSINGTRPRKSRRRLPIPWAQSLPLSSVSGGSGNTASSAGASVSGGIGNNAAGNLSIVTCGNRNTAASQASVVLGGSEVTNNNIRSIAPAAPLNYP
jgi:hypothetical protein